MALRKISLRISKGSQLINFYSTDSTREIIDKLVMAGLYLNRSEFIRMAIEEKLQRTVEFLREPFFNLVKERREDNED